MEFVQKRGIDASWLKIIAITGMTCDHIGIIFGGRIPGENSIPIAIKTALYFPGGLTFPIMAYLLIEGYRHTSDIKGYIRRMLIFALVTQPIFMWAFGFPVLNVLFTLLLGLLVLYLNDLIRERRYLFYIAVAGMVLGSAICDWGVIGILLVLGMRLIPGEKRRVVLPIAILVGATEMCMGGGMLLAMLFDFRSSLLAWPQIAFFLGSLCTIPLLLHYSGRRGRGMKYFFYIFYPAHLFLLAILRGALSGQWMPGLFGM